MELGWDGSDEPKSDPTLEQALLDIEGVRRASVHLDLEGGLSVRALVVPESDPITIVEDIRRVAAEKGVDIPASAIEILGAAHEVAGVRRRRFSSLMMKREEEVFQAQVSLRRNGDSLIGESRAATTGSGALRSELITVAAAVIDALRTFFGAGAEVEEVHLLELGGRQVCLSMVKVGPEHFVGSALVKRGEHDAVVRATLDAVNRPLVSPWDSDTHQSV